jgi:hypothetical protein
MQENEAEGEPEIVPRMGYVAHGFNFIASSCYFFPGCAAKGEAFGIYRLGSALHESLLTLAALRGYDAGTIDSHGYH